MNLLGEPDEDDIMPEEPQALAHDWRVTLDIPGVSKIEVCQCGTVKGTSAKRGVTFSYPHPEGTRQVATEPPCQPVDCVTPAELDELERLANAATPGPWQNVAWKHDDDDPPWDMPIIAGPGDEVVVGLLYYDGHHACCNEPDAALIAAARAAVPKLIAALREAWAEHVSLSAMHATYVKANTEKDAPR